MARDTSPIVKQSRREGFALHPKAFKVMAKKTGIPTTSSGVERKIGKMVLDLIFGAKRK